MTPSTTSVFHRDPRKTLPTAVGGEGMTLIDSDGKRYLDACGGAAVSCLGHGHPRVVDAICKQVRALAYAAEAAAWRWSQRAPYGCRGHLLTPRCLT